MDDTEKYNRHSWMTDNQWECAKMYADLVFGFHHIMGKIKPFGIGIEINTTTARFATFDYDGLTRLVIMAHDRCIRAEFQPSGPGMIKVVLHKRHMREGQMHERHPTLEDHIKMIRK